MHEGTRDWYGPSPIMGYWHPGRCMHVRACDSAMKKANVAELSLSLSTKKQVRLAPVKGMETSLYVLILWIIFNTVCPYSLYVDEI